MNKITSNDLLKINSQNISGVGPGKAICINYDNKNDIYSTYIDTNTYYSNTPNYLPGTTTNLPTTTTTTDTTSYYNNNYLLKKELEETKTNLNFLMKFLIMKGIIKNEQEFKDFVDAIKLADKLSEK